MQPRGVNRRAALLLGAVAVAMTGFGFALVPLYDIFCQVTGLNGKTGVIAGDAAAELAVARERWVTVEFDANVNGGLPWRFAPAARRMKVHPGEVAEAAYVVENLSGQAVTGRAVPSVAPGPASVHFKKIECFCFSEQTLGPGESREMPVRFVVAADLPERVNALTLSYTFFEVAGGPAGEDAI